MNRKGSTGTAITTNTKDSKTANKNPNTNRKASKSGVSIKSGEDRTRLNLMKKIESVADSKTMKLDTSINRTGSANSNPPSVITGLEFEIDDGELDDLGDISIYSDDDLSRSSSPAKHISDNTKPTSPLMSPMKSKPTSKTMKSPPTTAKKKGMQSPVEANGVIPVTTTGMREWFNYTRNISSVGENSDEDW